MYYSGVDIQFTKGGDEKKTIVKFNFFTSFLYIIEDISTKKPMGDCSPRPPLVYATGVVYFCIVIHYTFYSNYIMTAKLFLFDRLMNISAVKKI